jgi:acyl carrier protein
MQNAKPIQNTIRSFVVQKFPAAKKQALDENVPLLASGIVDSLGMLDLVTFLETTFAIQLSDEELTPENFATIRALATFVEQKKTQVGVEAR